jgi:hypothetical protein
LNQNQKVQTGSSNFQMPQSNWNNVVMGAITGAGEGFIRGMERIANNFSFGIYGDRVPGYWERQEKARQQAEQAGLGEAYKWATRAIDYGK